MNNRKLAVLLCVIAATLVVIRYGFRRPPQQPQEIVLSGNVDTRRVDTAFRVSGRVVKMLPEEGDRMQSGQLLAELDPKPHEDEVRIAEAQVEEAAAQKAKLEQGNRLEEIQQAKALVAQRQATFELATTDLKRITTLFEKNVVPKQQLDNAQSRHHEAQALLDGAREALTLATNGFRAEDIRAGQAVLNAAEARLEQARTRLADTKIFAPAESIVLTRAVEPGTVVSAGQTVYSLTLIKPVWVRAYAPEFLLGRIRPGMKARIYTDTAPDKPYTGQVGFLSPEAEFTPKNIETPELRTGLVYRMRILAENPDDGLRQGMPVTVKLIEEAAK